MWDWLTGGSTPSQTQKYVILGALGLAVYYGFKK